MSYQLHHADCLSILPQLPARSVDAVICDLPYGTTRNKWDSPVSLDEMWQELRRIVKPRGAIVLFGVQPFSSTLVISNLKGYKHRWVWNKRQAGNFAVAKYMPLTVDEDILVFTARGESANYYPQMRTGKPRIKGGRASAKNGRGFGGLANISYYSDQYYPTSILEFASVPRRQRLHASQKPVELLAYLIKTYTQSGDTVLDMAMGVGSTGVACQQMGCNFIGIEINSDYFAAAKKRIDELSGPLS